MASPYEGLQDFVDNVPEFVQPLIVAGLGMIPYVEGEGSAALGIIAGVNPIVAAVAGAAGNILAVVLVVLLSARVRDSVAARRRERVLVGAGSDAPGTADASSTVDAPSDTEPNRRGKARERLSRWLVRFGVPGASILAPLALPTQLTAAFFVASGVRKGWVVLWQVIAIVLWTGLVAAAALGFVSALGW
ncbi:small multidrug efflux protein [Microbacteriaceae bacterium VKM Ac-2855]|nr:small multidrug efflux protein [Microbacteriaceae bacterium VKM Ac-2855]